MTFKERVAEYLKITHGAEGLIRSRKPKEPKPELPPAPLVFDLVVDGIKVTVDLSGT